MEKSNQQTEILKLGNNIIKELSNGNNGELSVLVSWIGHYIAELIDKVENAKTEKERKAFQKECFETILKLWSNRSKLSIKSMPLGRIKPAIDILNEFKMQKDIWERMRFVDTNSWESLAKLFHESQMDAIRICIQAAIAEDAMEREKVWVDECSELLSPEEKEIIEELDHYLEERSSAITIIFDNEKTDSKEEKISKIERAFDRLESIADRQKNAIQKLRIALIKNKGNN